MSVSCECCVGSGHCDELIARSEESCRVCVCVSECVRVCVLAYNMETSTMLRPRPELGCWDRGEKVILYF
jgi:hypothetical protein